METDTCTVPYGRQSLTSDSDEPVQEEFLYCDLSIPLEGQIDVAVPSDVVTETIVSTTTNPSIRKMKPSQKKGVAAPDHAAILDDVFDCIDARLDVERNSDSQKFSLRDVLKRLSGESHLLPPSKAEREATKRMRDCLKKREMRQNPVYRKKELEKARQRMANKRQHNPDYRETERKRDRERRATARLDKETRRSERERDRISKKAQRDMYKHNLVPVTKCDYVTLSAYSLKSRTAPLSGVTVCQAGSSPVNISACSSGIINECDTITARKGSIDGKESGMETACDADVTDTNHSGSGGTNTVDQTIYESTHTITNGGNCVKCDIDINTFESEYTYVL